MMIIKKPKKIPNVGFVFLFYWVALVIWQNINPHMGGSIADTLIKMTLLGILALYLIFHARVDGRPLMPVLLFLANMLISFSVEGVFSLRSVLNYFYPVMLAFLLLVVGGKCELRKSQLKRFLNGVIVVVLYTVLYTLLFLRQDVVAAIRATNAYGNEVSSFFINNHEYALYLMAGIVSALLLLELNPNISRRLKFYYIGCIVLFLPNLILTFSRTYLFATLAIILIYVILHRKSKASRIIFWLAISVGVIILVLPSLRQYVFEVILKENTDAGRGDLFSLAWNTYKEGTAFQKIWGFGVSNIQGYFDTETSHRSIHNAYMQILLYYGIVGVLFLIAFLCSHMRSIMYIVKHNRSLGAVFIALPVGAMLAMMAQTVTIFTSLLDSYFLTIFAFIVPKYVMNAMQSGTFEDVDIASLE